MKSNRIWDLIYHQMFERYFNSTQPQKQKFIKLRMPPIKIIIFPYFLVLYSIKYSKTDFTIIVNHKFKKNLYSYAKSDWKNTLKRSYDCNLPFWLILFLLNCCLTSEWPILKAAVANSSVNWGLICLNFVTFNLFQRQKFLP